MLRIEDRHEREMLYGPTNEEMVTDIFRSYVRSYKDLPLNLYHLQWKFQDEVRPRFGLMRGREFLMKDAYSFDLDYEGAVHAYNRMISAISRCVFADVCPHGVEVDPDGRGHRTRLAAAISSAMNSSFSRTPAKAKLFCHHATISNFRCRTRT